MKFWDISQLKGEVRFLPSPQIKYPPTLHEIDCPICSGKPAVRSLPIGVKAKVNGGDWSTLWISRRLYDKISSMVKDVKL